MKQTRKIIEINQSKYPEFKDYHVLTSEIEDNLLSHPDISIESCKSLIEGVCKQIIRTFDKTVTDKNISDMEAPKAYKTAVDILDAECNKCKDDEEVIEVLLFETEFAKSFSNPINKLCEIRNKRGDICHGRTVPKVLNSTSRFAGTIKNFTDIHLAYMLEAYFYLLENQVVEKLNYDDLEDFNQSLDEEEPDFPIKKERYSAILYEYEYDTYATRYNNYLSNKAEEDTPAKRPDEEDIVHIAPEKEKEDILRDFSKDENLHYDKILKIVDDNIMLQREVLKSDIYETLISDKSSQRIDEIEEKLLKLISSITAINNN